MSKKETTPTEALQRKEMVEVSNVPVEYAEPTQWGAAVEFDTDDLLLPRCWLMQGLSEMVTDDVAKIGEIRNSLTKELLGTDDKPFECIFFYKTKTILNKILNEKKEIVELWHEELSVNNSRLPFTEEVEQGKLERVHCYNFYVLPVFGIEKSLPLVVTMRGTSFVIGKRLMTEFKNFEQQKLNSAGFVIRLKSKKQKNDKGTFSIFDYEVGRPTTTTELNIAYKWFKTLQLKPHIIDDAYDTDVPNTKQQVTPTSEEMPPTEDDASFGGAGGTE